VFDGSQLSKLHLVIWKFGYFWMPFLAPTLDINADPLFALVITLGLYLHHVEVADQDPASGSL